MAAPLRRRQAERTALSDRMMYEAAVSLLVEHGIAGTTLAAIGERAGYSRGLVAHRFGTKARLLAYVHDTAAHGWIARVQAAVGDATGVEALAHVVDALCGFIVESPDELRAMYLVRYASIDPSSEYRANVAKVHKAQKRDVERWITAGQSTGSVAAAVDASLAAELFCAAADGLLYRWLVTPRIPIEAIHDLFRRDVARALQPHDGP
jgi:AcrR family transcriptional regulator